MNRMTAAIQSLLVPLVRPAKILRVTRSQTDLPITETKFGGTPFLPRGEAWPRCRACDKPLSFVAQISFRNSGTELPNGDNFLVFFYCFDCLPWGDDEYDDQCWQARTYHDPRSQDAQNVTPPGEVRHASMCSVELIDAKSLPSWDYVDLIAGSSQISSLSVQANPDTPWEAFQTVSEALVGEQSIESRLGGYPHGPQGGYMTPGVVFIVQFDSLCEAIYDAGLFWGDAGIVILTMDVQPPHKIYLRLECC
jgi:hypothetical protein